MKNIMVLHVVFVAVFCARLQGASTVPDVSQAHAQDRAPIAAELDVDRSADHDTFARIRPAIVGCQLATVHLHYAFGHVAMTTQRHERACRLQITIEGELSEERMSATLLCDVSVMNMVDWLKSHGRNRETPPLSELQALSACHCQSSDCG
jgi:hypothetical protein